MKSVFAVVCVLWLAAIAMAGEMSVSGTGKITVAPDEATFTVQVISTAKTTELVMTDNNKRMLSVLTTLKDLGLKTVIQNL